MKSDTLFGIILIILIICYIYMPTLLVNFYLIMIMFAIMIAKVSKNDKFRHNSAEEHRRKIALKIAKIYLSSYNNIWRDLKLSSRYCDLILGSDGVSITAEEKNYPYRAFKVLTSNVHSYTDLWDMFCINFNHHKMYEDLVDDCRLYNLSIYEYIMTKESKIKKSDNEQKKDKYTKIIDINNCSEIELTELPGISIVMAKKAIKQRDAIGGFKSIDDFITFLNIKSHHSEQITERISCKKLKNINKKIAKNIERSVDL